MRSDALRIAAFNAPGPLLFDVDTRDDLALAGQQLAVRTRCYSQTWSTARIDPPATEPPQFMDIQPDKPRPASRAATR